MSYLLSRWLAAPATALRAGLVLGLAASTLAACKDSTPPPAAQNDTRETAEDTPLEVHLPASDNGALTFSIVDAPDHGTLSEISADGVITYTPSADYNGEDVLTFRATNRKGQSAQATVTITITPVNDTPTLSSVANQTIAEDSSTGDLAFTVGDVETAAGSLTVTATSSNTALVPNDPANLVFGGSGTSRTLNVVPAANANGSTTITLSVSDGSVTTTSTFTVDVTAVNDAPTISPVANQSIAEDSSTGELAFTVGDVETAADSLTVTATSSNTALVPNDPANLVFGGSGTSRTLKVVPVANANSSTTITLSVSDGSVTTTSTFTVDVTAVNDVPTISPVANQRIPAGSSTGDLAFTVGDVETAAGSLTVTATSSNTGLVPNDPSNLILGGSGSSRTLNVVPVASASGSTTITLSVSDGTTTTTTFTVDVTAPARLYWVTAAGSLWRVDVNGTNAIELQTGISGAACVATDPVTRTIFYNRGSAIVRADSDGANPVDIVANGGYPSGLAVDSTNRKLYWSDFTGKRVMRAELDGSNPTEVLGGIDSPSSIAFDVPSGKVYVITYNNTKIVRFNLDGTNLETPASNLNGQGVGLAVDSSGGKVYYSTRGNSIYVTNLNGSNITTLVTNQNTVHGIAIDVTAGRLYWADWLGTVLRSANLADGSDIQDVNSGSSRNLGLAFMPAP
ncbi:Ig-like domain-containing protein [Archangium lansingense]|uniref:Ig-like domain-containing protein n=1 Tax=Archangium lansingense TaxID=2995310 RepID=A0ABT4AHA7_9BACT|nr:Ig-like domain-containing protein [Archangium lansinium]MCY1080691.1 Ig-like domain-containing protein [Archangium lansinium]